MSHFYRRMRPTVSAEIDMAKRELARGNSPSAFARLERAHVLGQTSTVLHVRVHWAMLIWSLQQRDLGEFAGQLFRLVGASTKTFVGLIPQGNTGGSNVSALARLPIAPELALLIEQAKRDQ
jgi:Protein of unknown function (DUF3703)